MRQVANKEWKSEFGEIQDQLLTAWEELTQAFDDVTSAFNKSNTPSEDQIFKFRAAVGHIREARRKRRMHWHERNMADQQDCVKNDKDKPLAE